ncbi:hypothetical protein [Adhaeribacter rhizoryzae]|uniref:Uncharacterized protein n=1 Tax=Adhaeribacter rhizoryzae TaxID=2607907 RepID=A0A5M6D9P6_9BACT|nr:hypothetical protein [Adhaeribacter rhizoryzae]KAA5544234.1 hypothetical protein F0145_15115 [Adhaeribacter rhizoryzae]
MNIIEKGTGKQIEFLEKVNKSTWKKWLAVAIVLLLLAGGVFLLKLYPLVFSPYDFIFIAFFIVVASYLLVRVLRMK